jgi:glutathione S-transferase
MRLHDNLSSGNGYEGRLLLAQLGVPFERVEYDIDEDETRTARFLDEINPNGRIPVLEIGGGEFLPESNAILFYFAEGTTLLRKNALGGRASCSGCSSTQILKLHGTPELRFRALFTEGGAERLGLARADFAPRVRPDSKA